MSDRVTATLTIAPWDEEKLKQSADGRKLLEIIDEWGFAEDMVYSPASIEGLSVRELTDYEANYGTGSFREDVELMYALNNLKLWFMLSDEGSVEWGPSHIIYAPDGSYYYFDTLAGGTVMMSKSVYDKLMAEGGQAAVNEYWRLGELSYDLAEFMLDREAAAKQQD